MKCVLVLHTTGENMVVKSECEAKISSGGDMKNLDEVIDKLLAIVNENDGINSSSLSHKFQKKTGLSVSGWFLRFVPDTQFRKNKSIISYLLHDKATFSHQKYYPLIQNSQEQGPSGNNKEAKIHEKNDKSKKDERNADDLNFEQQSNCTTKKAAEKDLRNIMHNIQGSSKGQAISIDDDEDKPSTSKTSAWQLKKEIQVPVVKVDVSPLSVADSFLKYREFQRIHATYCKLRLVAMMYCLKKDAVHIDKLTQWFKEVYRENFFARSVLKFFVSEHPNIPFEVLFLQRFCADFIEIQEEQHTCNKIVILKKEPKPLFLKLMNELMSLLEQLQLPNFFQQSENPTPAEMRLLGSVESKDIDVRRVADAARGTSYASFDYPGPDNRLLRGQERPSINEINEKVRQIQNRIVRRGDMVKLVEVVAELCQFYKVASVRDIYTKDHRPFRQETDIPSVMQIIRAHGKANAFIQAFVTFRNICTLHELDVALCDVFQVTSFVDLKLGPLQKQMLVYDHFRFPPERDEIPQITTSDVFRLLWRFENDRYHAAKKGTYSSYEKEQQAIRAQISLADFMEHLTKQYGFEQPYESGVKVSSIGLAISMVKRAKIGDMKSEQQAVQEFTSTLLKDFDAFAQQKLLELSGSSALGGGSHFVHKLAGMSIVDGFAEMYKMLQNMKQEACKFLPSTSHLINFADLTMNALMVIRKDKMMTSIFHLLLSCASLKVLGHDDVAILEYLGFKDAVDEHVETRVREQLAKNTHRSAQITPVAKSLVTENMRKWLLQNESMTLSLLSRVEHKVCLALNTNSQSFDELGHGSFLKFVADDEELCDAVQLNLNMSETASLVSSAGSGSVSQQDVAEFFRQCPTDAKKEDALESASLQFSTSEIPQSFQTIYNQVAQKKKSIFRYEHATLCSNEDQKEIFRKGTDDKIEQLRELAIARITLAPYMLDLQSYLQWNDIFEKLLGHFKQFLEANFLPKDFTFHFFTTSQSEVYLKIENEVSVGTFTDYFKQKNANMSVMAIISLIDFHGSLDEVPLALLSKMIEESMLQLSKDGDKELLQFVLKCLSLFPFDLLCCIVKKLFLKPLSTIYGSLKVNDLLLETSKEYDHTARLHALGHQLCIDEWITDYKQETQNQTIQQQKSEQKLLNEERSEKKLETNNSLNGQVNNIRGNVDVQDKRQESDQSHMVIDVPERQQDGTLPAEISDEGCRAMIDRIRLEQFGVGLQLGETEQKLIEVHREREGRSLQRLSKELYTKDSHFVLELIQNADDNEYPEELMSGGSSERPTVAFIVESDKITILNNECGFTEKNIKALCDVGKSTKGMHRKGYIGQKGIGFKSVFRVTDAPEIHSNGFHIKYDASTGPNGYILPVWVEDHESMLKYQPNDQQYCWRTQIVLPLKKEMRHTKLTSRFHDIHSSLLLFLNRLQTVIIDDRVSNVMKVIDKKNVDDNLRLVTHNQQSALWFVVSKAVPINVKEDVNSTDISVAFPITDQPAEELVSQPVFAYLPLRSYGFKFIIQADFEVPSSREDIDKDSAWNQCILQSLPHLVVDAFTTFKEHSHFSGLDGVTAYFNFMDLEGHILGTFQQIGKQIVRSLQRVPCLPVSTSPREYVWVIPSAVVRCDKAVSAVVPRDQIARYLGVHYLDRDIENQVNGRVLESIGVGDLTFDQLVEVCRAKVREHSGPPEQLHQWTGKWFHAIYLYLQRTHDCTVKSLDTVRALPIFPMTDASVVNLKDCVAFFAMPREDENEKQNQEENRHLRLIETELKIISHHLMDGLGDVEKQQVNRLLSDLGVRKMTPKELIHDHIVPCFKSAQWKVKEEHFAIAYVMYIHGQLLNFPDILDLNEVQECMPLLTNKGLRCISSDDLVYLTPAYGNPTDLEKNFPSVNWTLLSEIYLKKCSHLQKASFCRFFQSLSLKSFFTIKDVVKKLHITDMAGSCWESISKTWPSVKDDTYVIEDLQCLEINEILDCETSTRGELNNLLSSLNQKWESEFMKFQFATANCAVKDLNGKVIDTTCSSIILKLRNSAWVGSHDESLHVPRDLFANTHDIVKLFDEKVNYLPKFLKSKDLVLTLGAITEVSFQRFVVEFKSWREEVSFNTSYGHVKNIYKYFEGHYATNKDAVNELLEQPFFFLCSRHRPSCDDAIVEGEFLPVGDVYWEDPSGLISSANKKCTVLNEFYPADLRKFFVQKLGVRRFPIVNEYLEAVCQITNYTTLPDKDACGKLFTIFATLGRMFTLESRQEELNDWQFPSTADERKELYNELSGFIDTSIAGCIRHKNARTEKMIPCSNNKFASLHQLPLLVNNKSQAKVFEKAGSVPLLYFDFMSNMIKSKDSSRSKKAALANDAKMINVLVFLKACGIKFLSEVYIEPEPVTVEMKQGCHEAEKILHQITPVVQRYISHTLPLLYKAMIEDKFDEYIRKSKVFTVNGLEVTYRLSDRGDVNITHRRLASVQDCTSQANLFVVSGSMREKKDEEKVMSELLTLFVKEGEAKDDLMDFIQMYRIVGNEESSLRRKNIPKLDEDEIVWEFKKPERAKLPPPPPKPVEEEAPQPKRNDRNTVSCWPPRNPAAGGVGLVAKPDSVREEEAKLMEKWKVPEYSNEDPNTDVVEEPPHSPEAPERGKRKRVPSEAVNESPSSLKPSTKKALVDPQDDQPATETSTGSEKVYQPAPEAIGMEEGEVAEDNVRNEDVPKEPLVLDKWKLNNTDRGTGHWVFPEKGRIDFDNFNQHELEKEYEDLPILIEGITNPTDAEASDDLDVKNRSAGHLGEKLIYDNLCEIYKEEISFGSVRIVWQNEGEETGAPYDLKIESDGEKEIYIEVKTSYRDEAERFAISSQQLRFAFEHQSRFHLYRVTGANSRSLKIKRLVNLSMYMDNKAVSLYMLL